jgi:hypothetical protein
VGLLKAQDVRIEAIVLGKGETALAKGLSLDVRRVHTPSEIMDAFADAYRRVVQAPYEIDNILSVEPQFEMKPHIEEAWIVVYGDDTLSEAVMEGPGGAVTADHAGDRWAGAGAYKVAYIRNPQPGSWKVRATGGGNGVAYAVVQRSTLVLMLMAPREVLSGTETTLVAEVRAGPEGARITDDEMLAGTTLEAEFAGNSLELRDDGTHGDEHPGDGLYSGNGIFTEVGEVTVRLHMRSPIVDRSVDGIVRVTAAFRYSGPPVEVDLGRLGVGGNACKRFEFEAEHIGTVPLELRVERTVPSGHELEVRSNTGTTGTTGGVIQASPGDFFEICLLTSPRAASSTAGGEHWATLGMVEAGEVAGGVPLHLRWQVEGLPWWLRWMWLILLILGILVLGFIIGGFVYPARLPRTLAITFVPEYDDLNDQTPQPVRQWRGVGIGFYRHARAFLHPDFRISGKSHGAIAGIFATRTGCRIQPVHSTPLYREALDGDWEQVSADGRRNRAGDLFRVGESGPFFRTSVRGG